MKKPKPIPTPLVSVVDFSQHEQPKPKPTKPTKPTKIAVTVHLDESVVADLKEVAARKRYSSRKHRPISPRRAHKELARDLIIKGLKNYWLAQEMYIEISEIRRHK